MHLTATGKLGRSLTTITKMDLMMLSWLTNSWYKQATEQSPLTSARYCMRVHTGLYRNIQVIRSRKRCKEHVVVSFFISINWMPELYFSAWPQWLSWNHSLAAVWPVLQSVHSQYWECPPLIVTVRCAFSAAHVLDTLSFHWIFCEKCFAASKGEWSLVSCRTEPTLALLPSDLNQIAL